MSWKPRMNQVHLTPRPYTRKNLFPPRLRVDRQWCVTRNRKAESEKSCWQPPFNSTYRLSMKSSLTLLTLQISHPHAQPRSSILLFRARERSEEPPYGHVIVRSSESGQFRPEWNMIRYVIPDAYPRAAIEKGWVGQLIYWTVI